MARKPYNDDIQDGQEYKKNGVCMVKFVYLIKNK